MGIIDYFGELDRSTRVTQSPPVRTFEDVFEGKPILSDAKQVTLAEFNLDSKNAITAHHLKDYRRKQFNLVLLPKIDILFDRLLEGSEFWNGKLHDGGFNS